MTTDDTSTINNNAPSHMNEQIGTWARWFVDHRLGLLSEGQVVTLTGLDRLTVREIDDLFNQALTCIEEILIDPSVNAVLKIRAERLASAPEHARVVLFEKFDSVQAAREQWTQRHPITAYRRTSPPVDECVLFLLDEDGAVGVGFARFDYNAAQPLCSAGSYYEIDGQVWEGADPIGWMPLEQAIVGPMIGQDAAAEVKP